MVKFPCFHFGGLGSIPGRGSRSHMLHSVGQKKKGGVALLFMVDFSDF